MVNTKELSVVGPGVAGYLTSGSGTSSSMPNVPPPISWWDATLRRALAGALVGGPLTENVCQLSILPSSFTGTGTNCDDSLWLVAEHTVAIQSQLFIPLEITLNGRRFVQGHYAPRFASFFVIMTMMISILLFELFVFFHILFGSSPRCQSSGKHREWAWPGDVIPPRAFVDSRRRRVVLLTGSQWAGSDDVTQSRGFVDKLPTQYMLRPTRRWAWHVTWSAWYVICYHGSWIKCLLMAKLAMFPSC